MSCYEEISQARLLLGLPERATMDEIKASYRQLMGIWHPDRCLEEQAQCEEMSKKIIAAYRLIITYCERYHYSFAKEDLLEHATEEELWLERFGGDSWGTPDKR